MDRLIKEMKANRMTKKKDNLNKVFLQDFKRKEMYFFCLEEEEDEDESVSVSNSD